MTMHPELEEAFKTGLSMPEVYRLLTKHHSGPIEEHIEPDSSDFKRLVHTDRAFWDNWKPLFHRLPYHSMPFFLSVDEPFMSIHKAFTREIISWLCDSERRSNVYLISETSTPTLRSHENTRAHLFANVSYDADRFGLPMGINPYSVWDGIDSTISELAAYYSPYRRILARKLIDNPRILEQPTRTRFKKLIHEPWQALREYHPQYIIPPPVVVLRFDSQLPNMELLRSILEFSSSPHSSSLLWIVSIDDDIRLPIQDLLHPFVPFQYFRLPVCYKDAPADAALILHYRFHDLRHKHKENFDEDEVWPSEEQMSQLIRVVAGVFETVEVMIQFVDWEDDGGPKAHLETFLAYMVDSPLPSNERPYCALDYFYTRALSCIPADLLSVFEQVFSIARYGSHPLPFSELSLACLLPLGKNTILNVLPHVSRLVVVRTSAYANPNPWITRFLEDPTRAGQFYTAPSEFRLRVFQAFLHILRHSSNFTSMLKLVVQGTQNNAGRYFFVIDKLRRSASYDFSHMGAVLASDQPFVVPTSLRHFDFRCLAYTCDKIHLSNFMEFLWMLYLERRDPPDLVRIEPLSFLDRRFIDKCEGLAEPLGLGKMGGCQNRQNYEKWFLLQVTNPKYVLLGVGSETVLAVLATRESDDERDKGVNIYTSAMLDYM